MRLKFKKNLACDQGVKNCLQCSRILHVKLAWVKTPWLLFLRMRSSLKSNQIWGPRGHQSENFPSFRVLLYGIDCSFLKKRAWAWETKESPCVLDEVNQTRISVAGEVESILKAQPVILAASQKPFLLHNSLHMDVYSGFVHNCQNVKATKMSPRW